MTNTKKRVFSGVLLTIFLFIITLGFFAYAFPKKEQGIARADSVDQQYVFTGSNNIQFNAIISRNATLREFLPLDVRFDLTSDLTNHVVVTGVCSYYSGSSSIVKHDLNFFNTSSDSLSSLSFPFNYGERLFLASSSSELSTYGGFPFYVYVNGSFNSNVNSIELGTGPFNYLPYTDSSIKAFYIKYIDENANFVYFEFVVPSSLDYNTRTYYISSDFSDNDIYLQGYNEGLSANQQNVYNRGYSAGNTAGYANGYSAGVASANDYSFLGLFGAVIDVPVNAFNSLFNFTILGVNLRVFILGLLSFAILLTILKWIKGGR